MFNSIIIAKATILDIISILLVVVICFSFSALIMGYFSYPLIFAKENKFQHNYNNIKPAQYRMIAHKLEIKGVLVAKETVIINAPINDYKIVAYLKEIGETISKGDPLAQLDLVLLRSKYITDNDNLNILRDNFGKNLISNFRDAKNFIQLKYEVEEAKKLLSDGIIRSPETGILVNKNIKLGQFISLKNTPIAEIINKSEIDFSADIAERELALIETGQRVVIDISGIPKQLTGSIRVVAPSINSKTHKGRIWVSTSTSENYKIGSSAKATVYIEEKMAVVVPHGSINYTADGEKITVLKNGNKETRVRTY